MTVVVDASVALKWYLTEPGTDAALALLQQTPRLMAPHLIVAEVCRGAWKAWKRGEIPAEQAASIARNVGRRFAVGLFPLGTLAYRASMLATELDYSTYDCFYLALAEREKGQVVTADARLTRRLEATPYAGLARLLDADR
jgi:predicted nucleic acid-binding protein